MPQRRATSPAQSSFTLFPTSQPSKAAQVLGTHNFPVDRAHWLGQTHSLPKAHRRCLHHRPIMVQIWAVSHRSSHRSFRSFSLSVPIPLSLLIAMTSLFLPSGRSHSLRLLHCRKVLSQKRRLHRRRRPGNSKASNRTILLQRSRLLSPGFIHNRERIRCRDL